MAVNNFHDAGPAEPLERFCCRVRLSLLRCVEGLADIAPDPRWKFPEVIAGRSYPENRLQHASIIQVHVYLYMLFLFPSHLSRVLPINRPIGNQHHTASGLQEGAVTIRGFVRPSLRHRPDHIVGREVRGGELPWEVTCRGVVDGIGAEAIESLLYKHPPAQWAQPVQAHLHGPYSLKFPT